jgi:phosphoribosylformimino-5-aminoimidazole carboxamide ribotide isomerase
VIIYPAVDLKGGDCVRLELGDMTRVTVFNRDPAAQARSFAAAGAEWLHVVDLDGATQGRAINADAVTKIIKAVSIPVQLGGGIRDMAAIERWLSAGVARVVLGTVAAKNPRLVRDAAKRFPGKIAAAIDARGGKVSVEGWTQATALSALDLGLKFEDAGVAALLFTDIDRDGVLAGANIGATAALAERLSTPVIASGGVAALEEVTLLARTPGIAGAVIGRALYDGRIDLAAAIKAGRC